MIRMASYAGKVSKGRRKASGVIAANMDALRTMTGCSIYPGSLNVVLKQPLLLSVRRGVLFANDRKCIWPISIGGTQAWIYRWRGCPPHIVEIVSAYRLRESGLIQDGVINFQIDVSCIAPMSLLRRIVWTIFWKWREDWYYRSDAYLTFAKKSAPKLLRWNWW